MNSFNYSSTILICSKIKDFKEYLKNIKSDFHKLDKRNKEKYLITIKLMSYTALSDETKESYRILYNHKAIKKLILEQFAGLNLQNFDSIIDDLLTVLSSITDTHTTPNISEDNIKTIFKTINQKIPEFNNILSNIDLDILILDYTDKNVNSATVPSQNFKKFKILCFCMKDNDEYKSGALNPIYVFLHELGHIICWLVTSEYKKTPNSFFQDIGKYFIGLTPDNPDALEVFADCFAMAIMYNTPLNKYNPFSMFSEELFIDLEKYFTKIIKTIK